MQLGDGHDADRRVDVYGQRIPPDQDRGVQNRPHLTLPRVVQPGTEPSKIVSEVGIDWKFP